MDILAENHITIENTAFYQDAPENSDVSEPIGREKPESIETTGFSGDRA